MKILSDIATLQLSQCAKTFNKGAELFVKKWQNKSAPFVKYFHENYIQQRSNWFEGVAMLKPSTNNGQEATNGLIKRLFTHNMRLPMAEMKTKCATITREWSLNLKNDKPFAENVSYSDDEFAEAYIHAKKSINMIFDRQSSSQSAKSYWFPILPNEDLSENDIKIIKRLRYETFDEFKEMNFKACKVTITEPYENHRALGECNCKDFFKLYKCVHVPSTLIRLRHYKVSDEVKDLAKEKFEANIPLPGQGRKRKRGAPKKTTPALQKD